MKRIDEHPAWSFSAPDRALWHSASCTAVIADPHLFYENVRGRRGAAIGGSPLAESGERLRALEERCAPVRLVVLGDFIDGRLMRREQEMLRDFLRSFTWQWTVTYGNHDRTLLRSAPSFPELELVESLMLDGWTLGHGDRPLPLPAIIGHEHPIFQVKDEVGAGTSVPAMVVWDDLMLLPAFSRWSGGVDIRSLVRGRGLSPLLDAHHRNTSPVLYLAAGGNAYRFGSIDAATF